MPGSSHLHAALEHACGALTYRGTICFSLTVNAGAGFIYHYRKDANYTTQWTKYGDRTYSKVTITSHLNACAA